MALRKTTLTDTGAHEDALLPGRILDLVKALARELNPQRPDVEQLGIGASLEHDFGLDSLARVELASRIEQVLGFTLPDTAVAEAETVADLADALQKIPVTASTAARTPQTPRTTTPAHAAPSPATLLDALEWQAKAAAERPYILLIEHPATPEEITFGSLRAQAQAVAAGLMARGVQHGEAVAIMLPTGREFFAAFFGALYAGGIPVPLYPPARPSQLESHLQRLAGILANCEARVLLTFDAARRLSQLLGALGTKLEHITTPEQIAAGGAALSAPAISASDLAFLQYTSGSTGQPKGVMLTHANLLANLAAMQRATGAGPADCFVSWLPLYHDMGLIGACLGALVYGYALVLMSPLTFLSHPVRWLRAVTDHRATMTAAPNFAYEICLNKIDEKALEGIDLSSLRLAFNGAETVSAHTLEHFAERFAPYGLRREALMPVYGLAECALGLTFPPLGRGPLIDYIDRATFLRSGVAKRIGHAGPECLSVVSCGRVLAGHAIRVVDPQGTEVPERVQGRIEFQGPSATRGYFRNPQQTAKLFDGDWLDTGDLGYLADGELYVTGRAKDIIIRGGHNIHPQELEEAIGQLPGVRKGGVAVFPAADPRQGTERVVVLAETREENAAARAALVAAINRLATDLIGLPVDDVVLAAPRSVLKTSSGKIRRAACREAYERGEIGAQARAPWIQLTRLSARAIRRRAASSVRRLGTALWGLRAVCVAALLIPPLCVALGVMPGLRRRRQIAAPLIRIALRLSGVSVRTSYASDPGRGPHVYVANHASYLDGPLLLATLPPDVSFVAKRELRHSFPIGLLLKRLGCVFVERRVVREAARSARELQARLRAGESLVVFAEGTFRRDPGLLPFHMGAFSAAATAGAAVIPVAIRGTRAMLPDGVILPRPAPLEVLVGTPLLPEDRSWRSAVKLRRSTRTYLLGQLGEPDLEHLSKGGTR